MWKALAAAAALICVSTAPAQAQSSNAFAGTWAFQTDAYGMGGGDTVTAGLSGIAVIRSRGARAR
jgi:hypothetical protein